MTIVIRHGGESHYVRPDFVHRTSVVVPTMNFDPGADVQAVAAAFTQHSADLQLQGLNGSLMQRMRNWWYRVTHKAPLRGFGLGYAPPLPTMFAGQIAPDMAGRVQGLIALTTGGDADYPNGGLSTVLVNRGNTLWAVQTARR